ncbi:hypothetical protein DUNSADRAFT_16200 [Dunaliella salina]|uniref:S1 motif domain-containing protein n=1 Tax=Dunaliella salina TaxID=3046 RepID=A0ABQ7G415_DUNSA|nr:hypothetical protein DUNSADRAFT_16200 [Dunaliella salina]|eukprot:KAF5829355.1 hypothetical protein DUNSADRAFT_16200 [Dunaliella salina]
MQTGGILPPMHTPLHHHARCGKHPKLPRQDLLSHNTRPSRVLPPPAAQQKPEQAQTATKPSLARPPPRADPWAIVKKAQQESETLAVEVKSINRGGLVVDSEAGRVLLSEKRVAQSQALSRLKVGDIQRGVVRNVEDYGAFVTLTDVPSISGLVHKSELSWDTFMNVDDVIKAGDKVTVKILDVDPVACRITLSIKQMQQDPLTQTLDNVSWGTTKSVPEDIQRVIDRLNMQKSIDEVIIMQQSVESHLFSQELQLFLTKAEIPGGFLVVARSGSTLQQLQIRSSLSRENMKDLLASVAKME